MEEYKLKELLNQMTVREKLAQLTQLTGGFFTGSEKEKITGPMQKLDISYEDIKHIGSVLNIKGAKNLKEIQKRYLKGNKHHIPLLFMADVISGYKTSFPVQLGLSCSWNMNLVKQSARATAKEATAAGLHVTFSPMVDISHDPRWGRVMEGNGEDPYLGYMLAKAMVEGFQGEDLSHRDALAACVKHFASYGALEGGREYNVSDITRRSLLQTYIPPFQGAIDAGCAMVMSAYNPLDGIPITCNSWMLKDVLRHHMGFNGVVISDWATVNEITVHGASETNEEAALKSIEAGLDIEMMSSNYLHYLERHYEKPAIKNAVDDAVYRVLKLKNDLGLFENPYKGADEQKEQELFFCKEHRDIAKHCAEESIVLLKNNGVLPLKKEDSVILVGPYATTQSLSGLWSIFGDDSNTISVYEGLKKRYPQLASVKGCHYLDDEKSLITSFYFGKKKTVSSYKKRDTEIMPEANTDEAQLLQEALKACGDKDIILLALGEHIMQSGEGGSRTNIKLPDVQLRLLKSLTKLNKKIVVILFNGRPLDLSDIVDDCDAILEAWYPGTEGGEAIASILCGEVNPSAKLTMSFPRTVGQIPVYYNHYHTGRPKNEDDQNDRFKTGYIDCLNEPLYPFGYGLSYTKFKYSDCQLSSTIMKDKPLQISVKIKNIGDMEGQEIVQLYIQDVAGSVIRPVKELKGYQK